MGRRNEDQVGPNESIKRGQIKLTNALAIWPRRHVFFIRQ